MRRGVAVERGGTGRNVTTPNCLIPGRAMRELIGNTGARGCVARAHAGRTASLSLDERRRGSSFRSSHERAGAVVDLGFTTVPVIRATSTPVIFNYRD